MRGLKLILNLLLIASTFALSQEKKNVVMLKSDGQQWGTANIDCIWISTSNEHSKGKKYEAEFADEHITGRTIPRSNASHLAVWGEWAESQEASITFRDIPGSGRHYIKIRYSKDGAPDSAIEIWINGKKQTQFIPIDQRTPGAYPGTGWNEFDQSEWLEIAF
jgi:hypothetical protein